MNENSDFFDLKVERDSFLSQLNESRKVEEYTDVKLQMGDKLFPAHRAVLSHSSPVLKALISDQWSTTNVCLLSDQYVDVEIMEDLLSFLYTGIIKLTPDNVHPVCVAAHFLQIPTLLEPSVKYLCQFITVENLFTLFEFSTVCELKELCYYCLRFVNNNQESVFESLQILEVSFKDFHDLIAGLKKFWNKTLRENTFHGIVRWIEKNPSERLNELPVLLKNIPMEELPLKFLSETVSRHPLVKDSISGIETVSKALANYRTYSTNSTPLWKNNQNMIVCENTDEGGVLHLYDSRTGVLKKLLKIPLARAEYGITVVNNQDIILCGGFVVPDPFLATDSVVMFEWSTQTWIDLPDMRMPCDNAAVAICNNHMYVVGAFSRGGEDSKEVLRYSFKTKKWEFVASMNKSRYRGFLIEHKNCLYAFGDCSKTIEKYDPARDKWTIVKRKIQSLCIFSVALHQNKFYIYGYYSLEVYDPETNSLDTLPLSPFEQTSLISLNGKLLAVGGYVNGVSGLIYEFDFPTGKWIEFDNVGTRLSYHSKVVGAFY